MDFRAEHLKNPSVILEDLRASRTALELFLKVGKAREVSLRDLQIEPEALLEINGSTLSHAKICELILAARQGREHAYAPYSHFNVGAAIWAENRDRDIHVVTGCNVENAAYGSTICAERTAAFKAVSEGYRRFYAYAVVGGFDDSVPRELREEAAKAYVTPCGSCRQVTNEFDANPCMVIVAADTDIILILTMEFILPVGFGPRNLGIDASSYDRHNIH